MRNKTTLEAIGYFLFAVFLMAVLDIIAKILLYDYSVFQLTFLRGLFSLIILAMIGLKISGIKGFKTKIPGWHFLRTCLMSLSSYTFFAALALLPGPPPTSPWQGGAIPSLDCRTRPSAVRA